MGREEMTKIAEAVNILGNFCGPRDIDELTTAALQDSEAELFNEYLQDKHGLLADYLEKESTNCGNNITFLLSLLEREILELFYICTFFQFILRKAGNRLNMQNYAKVEVC